MYPTAATPLLSRMEPVTPWQMPESYQITTRVRKPWKTGEDAPEHVLRLLVAEAVDKLSLSPELANRLRVKVERDRDAVLKRAEGDWRSYGALGERAAHPWRLVPMWLFSLVITFAGFALGSGLLAWHAADVLGLPSGVGTGLAVVLPLVLVVLTYLGVDLLNDGLFLTVIVVFLGTALGGFIQVGVAWFGGAAGTAAGIGVGVVAAAVAWVATALHDRFDWLYVRSEAQATFDTWAESLYGQGVLWAVAEVSTTATFSTHLPAHSRRVVDEVVDVDTSAGGELKRLTGLSRGSFALAGPRGVGKSTLIQQWARRDERDLAAVVSAPVGYKPDEFLIHLFERMCDAVQEYGRPDLRKRAEVERDALRFAFSRTTERERAVDIPLRIGVKLGLKRKVVLMRDDVPLNHPQRVDRFRRFLAEVGEGVDRAGGRVLIGVDELDRISDGDQAQQFLNELKAVFGIPNCYYLVSVSEDALADFELAAMGMRTVFDSAFDTVIRVDYLRFEQAKVVLRQCVVDIPEQFIALAYALSGGLARELMRIVDIMGARPADTDQGRSLGSVAAHLVERQLGRTTRAAVDRLGRIADRAAGARLIPVLDGEFPRHGLRDYASKVEQTPVGDVAEPTRLDVVVMIEYLATLLNVFDDRLDAERMRIGLTRGPGDFETLAKIRRYLGANPYGARELLAAFDEAWGLTRP